MNTIAKPPPPLRDNTPPVPPTNPVSQPNRVPPSNPVMPANSVSNTIPDDALEASNFAFGEAKSVTVPNPNAISFQVHAPLKYRRIYVWLWTNPSNAADYFVQCEIQLYRNGSKVGGLPMCEAVSPAAAGSCPETLVALTVASTTMETKDSIAIYPVNPTGTQPTALVLQPHCIYAAIDEIRFAVQKMQNMTAIRVWLGCLSSRRE